MVPARVLGRARARLSARRSGRAAIARAGCSRSRCWARSGSAILLGGRSELVRGLRGDGRDEYWARLDLHATALAGIVLITVVIGMCVWEWAHGRSGRRTRSSARSPASPTSPPSASCAGGARAFFPPSNGPLLDLRRPAHTGAGGRNTLIRNIVTDCYLAGEAAFSSTATYMPASPSIRRATSQPLPATRSRSSSGETIR